MAEKRSEENELDFTSPFFNPLRALYTANLEPPVPNAHIFNNISEYAKSLNKTAKQEPKQTEECDLSRRLKNIAENKVNKLRNRKRDPSKLEHLMKIKSKTDGIVEKVAMLEKTNKKPKQMNVLERMEEKYKEGPLSILYNCIEKKTKLKVWTRKLKGLRGVCVGYLIAFDKHMNLAMMDVDEMFAIEEEIELDPMEQLRRIEKKKDKKRKWRRKKREKLGKDKVACPVSLNEEKRTRDGEGDDLLYGQNLAMEIQVKECYATNIRPFEVDTEESKKFAKNDCIDEKLDSTVKDDESNKRKHLDNECASHNQDIQRMDVKSKERFELNINVKCSKKVLENDDCIDVPVDVDRQLKERNIHSDVSDNENVSEKNQDTQRIDVKVKEASATVGVLESITNLDAEDSDNNSIQENDIIDNSRLVNTEFITLNNMASNQKLGKVKATVEQPFHEDNTNTTSCEDRESVKHLNDEITIDNILEEVKQTESEVKEAETLVIGSRSGSTYNPSTALEGNVLEYDEESQDSVICKETNDEEGSSVCVETLTLHHKIIYEMEKTRGTKQDCEMVGSLGDEQDGKVGGSEKGYEIDGGTTGFVYNDGGSDGALADESDVSTDVGDGQECDGSSDDDGNDCGGGESDGMVIYGRGSVSIHEGDGKDRDDGSNDASSESIGMCIHVGSGTSVHAGDGKECADNSDDDIDDGCDSGSGDHDGDDTGNDSDSNFIVAHGSNASVSAGDDKEFRDGNGTITDGILIHDGNDSANDNDVEDLGKDYVQKDDSDCIDGDVLDDAGIKMETDLSEQKHEVTDDQCLFNVEDQITTEEVTESLPEIDNDTSANTVQSHHDINVPNDVLMSQEYNVAYNVTGIDQHKSQSMLNTNDQTATHDKCMDPLTDELFEMNVIESNVECKALTVKADETAEFVASKSETRLTGGDVISSAKDGRTEADSDQQSLENSGKGYSVLLQQGKEIKEDEINKRNENRYVGKNEIKEISVKLSDIDKPVLEATELGRNTEENEVGHESTKREGKQSVTGNEAKEISLKPSDANKSIDTVEGNEVKRNIDEKEEGELSSSSEEENLDLCVKEKVNNNKKFDGIKSVDIEKRSNNLDKNRSKYTNLKEKKSKTVKSSVSHVKKSTVGKDETSSIKTQKDGDKELNKRKHSISSTRERNCKTKDKTEHKLPKEGRQNDGERGLHTRDCSSRKARTKDHNEGRKISHSKERKSDKENTNTSEKKQRSCTDQKPDTSSRSSNTRDKESTTTSKSIRTRHSRDSTVETTKNFSEKIKSTVSESKRTKIQAEPKTSTGSCEMQQRANTCKDSIKSKSESTSSEFSTKLISRSTKRTKLGERRSKSGEICSQESGYKIKSLSKKTSSKVTCNSNVKRDSNSSESFTKLSKSKIESESGDKRKPLNQTQVRKSGRTTSPNTRSKIEDPSKSTVKPTRKTGSGSETSVKYLSQSTNRKHETKSTDKQQEVTAFSTSSVKSKQENCTSSQFMTKSSSNTDELKNESKEGRRQVKRIRNVPDDSSRGKDNIRCSSVRTKIVKIVDKKQSDQKERKRDTSKDKTDSKTSSGKRPEAVRRESSSLTKDDNCRNEKRGGKKVFSKKDNVEKNAGVQKMVSSGKDENYDKESNKFQPLKKEESLSKNTRNKDEGKEEYLKRISKKEKTFSSDEKPQETKNQKVLENDKEKTQKGTEITGKLETRSANTKTRADKSLKSMKGESSNPNEGNRKKSVNSDKQKDTCLKTTKGNVQKDTTETFQGKEAVAKRKLTVDEYKRRRSTESKHTLDSSKEKEISNVRNKPRQSKTLKQSENVHQAAKSKSFGQYKPSCEEDKTKIPGKRKRDVTPVRSRKKQKTTKMDPNQKKVKTKEAKHPGKVITVRILKTDRGKALVLKRRHVNQLFIRGDNIIMVAYENVVSSEVKL